MIGADDIIKIIENEDIGVDINTFNHEKLLTDQGLDSLDMMTVLFAIEELYQIKIPEEDVENGEIFTINALVEYVNRKKNDGSL